MLRKLLLLSGLLLPLSGCAWAVRDATDQVVSSLATAPFDTPPEPLKSVSPPATPERASASSAITQPGEKTSTRARTDEGPGLGETEPSRQLASVFQQRPAGTIAVVPEACTPSAGLNVGSSSGPIVQKIALLTEAQTDIETTAIMQSTRDSTSRKAPVKDDPVLTAAWTQPAPGERPGQRRLDLEISRLLPGSEAPRVVLSRDRAVADREIERLFPELPELAVEPKPLQGPSGKPYTLADFQRMAAANSPVLRQAASDVKAAEGDLIQAKTYPNPTLAYVNLPSANNNTETLTGGFLAQPIITGGKIKLGAAAAQKDLDNAVLALKRARMDLATAVRNAYVTLLVDVETLAVTRALAHFSDEVYRLQVGLLKGTSAAPYEPTALRAQTYLNRLAYKQAIASYIYDWKALVATLGFPQLPLSEIAGQVDRFVPYYDYDEVRTYVLQNHTDVLSARNGIKKAQYQLKLAQVTPIWPNLNVNLAVLKDFGNPPFGQMQTLSLGMPISLWNQNKGNIIAAQGALIRATKESHRVEVTLTNNLALVYENYRNNLYAIEAFRRDVLPDLVRYYRGIYARRQIDPNSAFGDLVFAQENFSSSVQTYLGILQSLWTSVVGLADFLQTDDLYQLATRHGVPALPDFAQLRPSDWVQPSGGGGPLPGATAGGTQEPPLVKRPPAAPAAAPAAGPPGQPGAPAGASERGRSA